MDEQRTARVRQNLAKMGIEQALICDPRSVQYLCGVHVDPGERFFGLLLRADGSALLLANRLFPIPETPGVEVVAFDDTDDPLALLASATDAGAPLGCDKTLPARFLIPLMERACASSFVLCSQAVDAARAVKDAREQQLMREASRINDAAMSEFAALLHDGVTEIEVAEQLAGIYRSLGAAGHSFEPIVSFGANAADPHHEPDATPLRPGDVALFDVGCRANGYCSDMTRTFFWKDASQRQCEVYDLVRRANETAAAMIAPGVRACDIDAAAREVIAQAGFGAHFTHRLGHQIGLDVHEPGDISAANGAAVAAGFCFSDEPGIYLPGEFGVRIEDLILVTEGGCEVLNAFSHELTVLGA